MLKVEKMQNNNDKARIGFARGLARNLLTESDIQQPPIALGKIVERLKQQHDLTVYPWVFTENIDGIQIAQEGIVSIGYNQLKHPHRQRFTIAHEIGHFLMGHTKRDELPDFNTKDPREIEANHFAAELLIPMTFLKDDFKKVSKDVKVLAKRYFVSEEAMWWRIMDCKLI